MTKLTFTADVAHDFERIVQHLQRHNVKTTGSRIAQIMNAASVLKHSPLIGRPINGDMRELVIGKGATGYVLLYRYAAEMDEVFILAVRSHREVGYSG